MLHTKLIVNIPGTVVSVAEAAVEMVVLAVVVAAIVDTT